MMKTIDYLIQTVIKAVNYLFHCYKTFCYKYYVKVMVLIDKGTVICFAFCILLISAMLFTYFSKNYYSDLVSNDAQQTTIKIKLLFTDYISTVATLAIGIFTISALLYAVIGLDKIKKESKFFAFVAIEFRDAGARILLSSAIYWWSIYARVFLDNKEYANSSPLLYLILDLSINRFCIFKYIGLFLAGISILHSIFSVSAPLAFSIYYKIYNKNIVIVNLRNNNDYEIEEFVDHVKLLPWSRNETDLTNIDLIYKFRSTWFFMLLFFYSIHIFIDIFSLAFYMLFTHSEFFKW